MLTYYEPALLFFSLLLCASGAALLYRSGIVHTGIIAQMVLTAITYGYAAQYGVAIGILAATVTSISIVLIAVVSRTFNSRSYILFLYCFSLASIAFGNFVMDAARPSGTDALRTSAVAWPLSTEMTLMTSTVLTGVALCGLGQLSRSWRGVMLTHWKGLAARTLRDAHLSGTFGPRRLSRALGPIVILTAILFTASALLGYFALYGSYSSGGFDILPFTALIFALITVRPVRIFILVASYSLLMWWLRTVLNAQAGDIPIMALYIVYGAAFFIFSWYVDPDRELA